MRIIAMIPARYEAARFPGKLLKDLEGKSVILRTYERTLNTGLFDEVYVVTDSDEIGSEIEKNGGKVIKSQKDHACGTDRIAEAVEHIETDIIINVQGDEPFIDYKPLASLVEVFKEDEKQDIDLASLMQEFDNTDDIQDPNKVKVIVDKNNCAMYFSRSPIPYQRDPDTAIKFFRHVGVYAFRRQAIMDFYYLPMGPLEATEKLEGIRFLEYGKKIKMVETTYPGIGIDTPQDLEAARAYLRSS